jgi:ABC-type Na+ efflux pump permease subunit
VRYVGAILSKELKEVSRRKRTFFLRTALPLIVFIFLLLCLLAWTLGNAYNLRISGRELFFLIALILLGIGFLLTPAYCAPLITSEREQHTLEIMLSTPIRYYEIVVGKIASRGLMLLLMMVGAMPILSVCFTFGGVSARDVVMVFCILLTNVLTCAGTAIVIGSIVRSSTRAIMHTYCFLIGLGLISIWMINFFNYHGFYSDFLFVKYVCAFIFILMNPYMMLEYLIEPLAFAIPSYWIYIGIVANIAFFFICIILSSFILRKTAYPKKKSSLLRHFFCGEKKNIAGINRVSKTRRGRFWSNPVYWKECHESALSKPNSGIPATFLIFTASLSVYFITLLIKPHFWFNELGPFNSSDYSGSLYTGNYYNDERINDHIPFILGEFGIVFLTMIALSTGSFAKERSKRTLEALMLTTLENRSIWIGKSLGICRQYLPLLAVPFLHLGLCTLHGIFPIIVFWIMLINISVIFVFFTVVSLGFAILLNKRLSAFMATFAIAIAVSVLISMFAGLMANAFENKNIFTFILSFSPSFWIAYPFIRNPDGVPETIKYIKYFSSGIGFIGYISLYTFISIIIGIFSIRSLRQRLKME